MPQPWTTSASATHRRRGRRRHARRGLGVLHLEPLGRDRSRAPAGPVLPRHAVPVRAAAARSTATRPSRSPRPTPDPFSARVRAARPSVARAAPTRTSCCSAAATSGAACAKTSRSRTTARRPAFCSLELVIDADFADLFEVKEGRVHKQGQLDVHSRRARGSRSRYERHSFERGDARRLQRRSRASTGTHVHVRGDRAAARAAGRRASQVTPVIGDAGDHAPLPVRPAGRAVDAGRAPRGVAGAHAGRSRPTTTSSARCSNARRRTSPGCASSTPSIPDRAVVAAGRAVVHDAVRPRLAASRRG